MERILIVRLGAMGDVLHALPAVAALHQALPGASLGWAVERRWAELLPSGEKSFLDQIHLADTVRWRKSPLAPETRREFQQFTSGLKVREYHAALDFQGAIKSALVARLSGAELRFGFLRPKEKPAAWLYRRKTSATAAHVIEQNFELAMSAALTLLPDCVFPALSHSPAPELLPNDPAAETWCERELKSRGLKRFAVLNPGAGWVAKQWPPQRYAEVARAFAEERMESLINIGPGPAEAELADRIEAASPARRIVCSIPQLMALTRRAALFVGGDTGPMHLANLFGVPVVALFGPTDPARNGPYYSPHKVLRSKMSSTSYSHRKEADPGLHSITAEEAIEAARELLG